MIFFYLFSLFFFLFLQIFLRSLFSQFMPNFLLLAVVYFSLFRGEIVGECFGFSLGLFADAFSLNPFGSQAFLFTLIAYLVGRQKEKIDSSNPVVQILLVFSASLIYFLGLFLFFALFSAYPRQSISLLPFFTNVCLTIPSFWLLGNWFKIWGQD